MSAGSQERGQLLESVWGGLNSTLIASLLRLREQAALYKDRWARASLIKAVRAGRHDGCWISKTFKKSTCCAMQHGCSGVHPGEEDGLAAEREQ